MLNEKLICFKTEDYLWYETAHSLANNHKLANQCPDSQSEPPLDDVTVDMFIFYTLSVKGGQITLTQKLGPLWWVSPVIYTLTSNLYSTLLY